MTGAGFSGAVKIIKGRKGEARRKGRGKGGKGTVVVGKY